MENICLTISEVRSLVIAVTNSIKIADGLGKQDDVEEWKLLRDIIHSNLSDKGRSDLRDLFLSPFK